MSQTEQAGANVLTISGVAKHFGGVVALDGVDVDVFEGELVGIIGPNGAGKSTLFNCIMGIHSFSSGHIEVNEQDITNWPTHKIVNQGISRTFQEPRVFGDLTVRENMLVNQNHRSEQKIRTLKDSSEEPVQDRVTELLDFVDLLEKEDDRAEDLSTGQKKLLNIANALLSDPEIVLLDEPVAGVNPALIEEIVNTIKTFNDNGTTFLVIEHNIEVIRQVSERLYVLANGQNLVSGAPEEVLQRDDVLEVYFGE